MHSCARKHLIKYASNQCSRINLMAILNLSNCEIRSKIELVYLLYQLHETIIVFTNTNALFELRGH